MGKSTTTTDSSKTADPWEPSTGYLKDIMSTGNSLYKTGAGSGVWSGNTVADLDPELSKAFDLYKETADKNAATSSAGYDSAVSNVASSGLTSKMDPYLGVLSDISGGTEKIDTGDVYKGLLGKSLTQNQLSSAVTGDIATKGAADPALYGNVYGAAGAPSAATNYLSGIAKGTLDNPYLTQALDDNASRISNRVNSAASGLGRYGSYGHGDTLARSISAANAPILADLYNSAQDRAVTAAGAMDTAKNAGLNTQLSALTGLRGEAGTRLSAADLYGSGNRADTQLGLDTTKGLSDVQGQNIANKAKAAETGLDTLNTGQTNALGWAALMPELNDLTYDQADRYAKIGDYNTERAQEELTNQIDLYNEEEQMPWTQLGKYSSSITGLSGLLEGKGTTTGTETKTEKKSWLDYLANAAGAAAGAYAGGKSDRTEKTDIEKEGKSDITGLDLYSYRYKDDPKTYPKVIGPMAQDIEKKYPGSTKRVGGKLVVKPHAMGLLGGI